MEFDNSQLMTMLPEIVLLTGALLVLLVDLMVRDSDRMWPYALTLGTLMAAFAATLSVSGSDSEVILGGNYVRDAMGDSLKGALLLIAIPLFIYAREGLRKMDEWRTEYLTLGLFSILGMMVMISANGFISLYLGLELLTLSLYALVAYCRDSSAGAEAAMKYFVLGALASGLLLYGISMIYGATGKIDFPGIMQQISAQSAADTTIFVFGLVFVVIGIAFKFGAVPFHMWMPDVYQGSPTPVTLLIGSLPKIAAVAIALRVLAGAMESLHQDWYMMLVILAILSMALGNIVAIAQQNIKRMLAYSTISHVGFIFLGILSGTNEGYRAAMFYAVVYALMAVGAFGVLIALDRKGVVVDQLHQLRGLNDRNPWLAVTMLLIMFSMAGVPPTVGFWAKLFVLEAVVSIDLWWLAVIAVFFSIIGAFYYIRVVKFMYFDKPMNDEPIVVGGAAQTMLAINGLAILLFGLFPVLVFSLMKL
jgi:NADH-quinone oxidoreductase subunit N